MFYEQHHDSEELYRFLNDFPAVEVEYKKRKEDLKEAIKRRKTLSTDFDGTVDKLIASGLFHSLLISKGETVAKEYEEAGAQERSGEFGPTFEPEKEKQMEVRYEIPTKGKVSLLEDNVHIKAFENDHNSVSKSFQITLSESSIVGIWIFPIRGILLNIQEQMKTEISDFLQMMKRQVEELANHVDELNNNLRGFCNEQLLKKENELDEFSRIQQTLQNIDPEI